MTQFYSRVDTAINGDVYSIPFSYIKNTEIEVYIDEVLFSNWYFLNESQIKLNTIPSGNIISIRRKTNITERIVDFTNNTMLIQGDLNLSQDHILNAVQEVYDNNTQIADIVTTANTKANNALSNSNIAVATANSANTKADSAVSTANSANAQSNEALTKADTALSNSEDAVMHAGYAVSTSNAAKVKVDVFEQDINTVLSAADRVMELEQASVDAQVAANRAVVAANEATNKANIVLNSLSDKVSYVSLSDVTVNLPVNSINGVTYKEI